MNSSTQALDLRRRTNLLFLMSSGATDPYGATRDHWGCGRFPPAGGYHLRDYPRLTPPAAPHTRRAASPSCAPGVRGTTADGPRRDAGRRARRGLRSAWIPSYTINSKDVVERLSCIVSIIHNHPMAEVLKLMPHRQV